MAWKMVTKGEFTTEKSYFQQLILTRLLNLYLSRPTAAFKQILRFVSVLPTFTKKVGLQLGIFKTCSWLLCPLCMTMKVTVLSRNNRNGQHLLFKEKKPSFAKPCFQCPKSGLYGTFRSTFEKNCFSKRSCKQLRTQSINQKRSSVKCFEIKNHLWFLYYVYFGLYLLFRKKNF